MKVLNIDLVGPFTNNEYILVVICTHSRWIEYSFALMPLPSLPPVLSSRILDATELSTSYAQTEDRLS